MAIADHPANLTTVATFPEHYFLENLAVRTDGSILVTVANHGQLWYVPAPRDDHVGTPELVHTFDGLAFGIAETEPDVFYVSTALPSALERLDLRDWSPGTPAAPTRVIDFDETTALNGSCLLAPGALLLADSLGGRIWRVDLADNGIDADSRVWLEHRSMTPDPGNGLVSIYGPQPGLNGIRYSPATGYVYYTSTARKLFYRVPVDPATFAPAGPPEEVAADIEADDFCIDDDAGVAYLTTHTGNTIVRISLEPGADGSVRETVAGEPFSELLVGPSSAVWARDPAGRGRTAYVTTDGGHTAVTYAREGSDGNIRPAALLRVEFDSAPAITPN